MMSLSLILGLLTTPQALQPAEVASKLKEKLQTIECLTVDAELLPRDGKGPVRTMSIQAMRPNFFVVKGPSQWFIGAGSDMIQFLPLQSEYMRMKWVKDGLQFPFGEGFALLNPPTIRKENYTKAEAVSFEGQRAIALTNEQTGPQAVTFRTYIDSESWLPLGYDQEFMGKVDRTVYRNLKLNVGLKPEDFAWTPPKGAIDAATKPRDPGKYLEVGQPAPNFKVTLMDGRKMSLSQALKGKKGLLVNFWFVNCGYCLLEMPELDALYADAKAKGLEMVVVNDVDTRDEVAAFLKKMKYRLPVAIDEGAKIAEAYKVKDKGHPVTYLIDSSGKVAHVQVGFDPEKKLESLKAELAKLGIKWPT